MFYSARVLLVFLIFIQFCLANTGLAKPIKLILKQSAVPVNFNLLTETPSGCDVLFELNELSQETVIVQKETFQALTISGGAISGLDGQPGLPTYSGMIAVPQGHSAKLKIISAENKEFSGMRVFPVQPDKAEAFVIDRSAYLPQNTSGSIQVKLGDPVIYLGQTVVPFTVHPVQYQPGLDLISVTSRLNLHFEFVADGKGLSSRRDFKTRPQSFTRVLSGAVINNVSSVKSGTPSPGPGTYLVLAQSFTEPTLAPLLDWRRRQGYNVMVSHTNLIGQTFAQIKAHIQNIYDTVEPPLEHILLVGDADGSLFVVAGTEVISGFHGETDHYYTTLDGDDILSDVHIGRLTVRDPTQLSSLVQKIVAYETSPPMADDPDWFSRAAVVGDPDDSGITTIYVNQWLKAQLEDLAFTQVDTIFGGNFPTLMHNSLNQGLSVFGYRGFYSMSGYSPTHITMLENGNKMPFAVLPTCDTGSFRTHITAHSEAFLRAPNGGGIGAIALSTSGTHTRYNNCVYHGIWEGMLNTDDHHMGSALTRGKLELYNNYYLSEPNSAEIWATWSNLMGDPATDIWLDRPTTMDAVYPSLLPVSANSVPVTVTSGGLPVEGALVALYKSDELRVTGYTNGLGQVNLPISGQTSGTLLVTITMHNRLPYRGWINLGDVDVYAGLGEMEISGGNGDAILNPGETVDLRCMLNSLGTDLAPGVTAILICNDPLVTILDAYEVFGDIPSGGNAWCQESFQFQISPLARNQHSVEFDLVATNGSEEWTSAISLNVQSPEFTVLEAEWAGQQSNISPGDHGDLTLTISNTGSLPTGAMGASLTTESPWILITDAAGAFGAMVPGEVQDNSFNRFGLQVSNNCYPGHLATFELELALPDGLVRTTIFQTTVGEAVASDPLGPDQHGYFAFDNTDTAHTKAPVFQWTEINPTVGGPGTSVGLTDFGFEQDDTRTLELPFTFQYYGQEFDRISVCSNGWVAMGETSLKHYRNFTIPSAGSPNAMIAPFWDNLFQSGDNLVYYWHDEANGVFIVEWSGLKNQSYDSQTFQLILRDSASYPTSNGDGEILFQYYFVENSDYINGHATVGIQNLTGDDGLLYTYWNQYAAAAAPLIPGRAILFTPTPDIPAPTCDVTPSSFAMTMAPGQTQEHTLVIANNGQPYSELFYSIEKADPDAPVRASTTKSMAGSTMTASLSVYPVGQQIDIVFSVTNNSPDNEYMDEVSLNFPLGVSVVSGTDLIHSGVQRLSFNQASGDGANCIWDGGYITSGNTATCALTLDFSFSSGAILVPYVLIGDNFGSGPHSVEGTIILSPDSASITLLNPNGGDQWVIREEATVSFLSGGTSDYLKLELDRDDGLGWQTIVENIPSTDTSATWLVEGPVSAHCLLRLSDSEDSELFDMSDNWFTIGNNLSWVQLDSESGTITAGGADEISFTINTAGLDPGVYNMDLVIRQMASGVVVVPVLLEVSGDLSGNLELPGVTRLEQNHPNPFNPQTEISFILKNEGAVKLKIYNTQGRLVRTLVDGNFSRGLHQVVWRGQDDGGRRLSSGMYLYRMETESGVEVRKMLLVK